MNQWDVTELLAGQIPASMPAVGHPTPNWVTGTLGTGIAQEWIAQNSVWQMIKMDNSLTDSSAELAAFAARASNSRYGWLTSIEDAIMSGDTSTAQSLMAADKDTYIDTVADTTTGIIMRDGLATDYIVDNYLSFYHVYMKYMDSTMTGDDSLQVNTMAHLCPYTDGNVVYMAQALYSVLYDDTAQFDGSCETDTSARHAQPETIENAATQGYQLYPNPNEGSFMLKQMVTDAMPVDIAVKDVLGREVYIQQVKFNSGKAQLQLNNLNAGVYILHITDSKGRKINYKFVLQK